jgi:hypothetical protein
MGYGLYRSTVFHELSEQCAEQENRKELRKEPRRASHESLRPMGQERFSCRGGG